MQRPFSLVLYRIFSVAISVLGAYFWYQHDWTRVAGVAATFSTVTLAQLVTVLQDIRDMIYDQTMMMAQDGFNEDSEFDHPDYPIEGDDE